METIAPPAPAPAAAPPAPAASPKSPVPPVGSNAAHLEAARKVFAPAAKPTAPAPAEAPKPVAPAAPESIIKKVEAPKPAEPKASDAKPAPAPQEFPEDKLAEPTTEAAKAGWKELKALTKAERNRATALEGKVADLQKVIDARATAAPADTAAMESLRADHKTLSDRLLVLDLKNHPDFHKQYVEPVKKAFTESATLLADNGVADKVDFDALLAKPRVEFAKTVSELASKMNAFDAATFTANMRSAFDLKGQEAVALSKASDVASQLQARTARVQRQAFEGVAADIIPNFTKLEIKAEMSADDRTAAESYNQSVDSLRSRAESRAFGKVSEKDVATMAFREAALEHLVNHGVPFLEKRDAAQRQLIASLTAELTALRGGKAPPVGGGDPAPAAPANESIEQSAKRVWGRR